MTALWLAVLLSLAEPGTSHADLRQLAAAVSAYPEEQAAELLGIAWIESRWTHAPKHSHAGACGYFGALGGRYKIPSCKRLEKSAKLAAREAVRELAYWKRHCGDAYLDAWNAGWARCWDGPQAHHATCTKKCKAYSTRVRQKQAELLDELARQRAKGARRSGAGSWSTRARPLTARRGTGCGRKAIACPTRPRSAASWAPSK